jgi:glycerophosphoryl diester phosphodiesterase
VKYGFAHRGGGHGPDNAIETFTAALERGADGLETDAWLSLDGAVVLDHDGVVAGSGGGQPIAQVRRDELPAHMATLDDLYAACGTDFNLAVDVKTAAIAAALVDVAHRHDADDRLWVVAPEGSAALLQDLDRGHRAVTIRGEDLRLRRRGAALRGARELDIEAVNARWMWWTSDLVASVHALGMLAFGYDAQRRSSLRRCRRIGLDGVFSDNVETMVAVLRSAG